MFNRFCLILSLAIGMVLLAVLPALAESVDTAWVRVYNELDDIGGDSYDIAVDNYGNVYVTGYTDSGVVYADYATIKYDSLGNMLWLKRYDGPGNFGNVANAIALDSSGCIYVTGGSSGEYATIKYYPCADTVCTAWVRRSNGQASGGEAIGIAVDGFGNVYVTGQVYSESTGWDWCTIKYDSLGAELWLKKYAGEENVWDEPTAIAVDGPGNVYVTGSVWGGAPESGGTGRDYCTIKYYPDGETAWVRTYDGPGNDEDCATAIAVDGSGNVCVTGFSAQTSIEIEDQNYDCATIKYLPDGDIAPGWPQRYNGPTDKNDGGRAIAVDGSGNIYVTGYRDGGFSLEEPGQSDYATIRYYPNGDTAWVRTYNGPANEVDHAYAIALDAHGNVYVTGECRGIGTRSDYGTVKYDPDGNEKWSITWNGPGNRDDEAYAIAVDKHGNVYITGNTEESDGYDDCATIKYVQTGTDVEDETGDREKPSEFALSQNYPNPFNQSTKIEFTLTKSGVVSLNIYDLLGRKVKTLVSGQLSSGYKSVLWDGKNDSGKDVASGIYFYQIKVEDPASGGVGDSSLRQAQGGEQDRTAETKKLVLLK